MQIAAIFLLLLLCAALTLRLYAVEKNLRAAADQLRARERSESTARIGLQHPVAATEDLLAALNALLEGHEEERAAFRRQEQAIRQQIANVSHDLRTPLTSILGYLQLLEGDTLAPGERAEYLAVVQSRAKSLQSLITSFYDLSRLEGGEYPLQREPVDLHQALSRVAAEFYTDFTDRGFAVAVELEEGLPTVQADPGGVLRVFTNLARNALDHGRERLTIRLCREGDRLLATFSNDAGDLTEGDLAHVFDRFYTADKMRTGQGTGLGLAIVKTLTQRMGQTVQARLEDGIFSITVAFPL